MYQAHNQKTKTMTVGERKKLEQRIKDLEAQLQSSKELYAAQTKELVSAKAQILELVEELGDAKRNIADTKIRNVSLSAQLDTESVRHLECQRENDSLKQTINHLQHANDNLSHECDILRQQVGNSW
jgi:chromosome segregation ATPase